MNWPAPRLLREPIVVFLSLGLLLFALDRLWNRGDAMGDFDVEIRRQEVERLGLLWRSQSGRLPTEAELDKLVQGHVREEILYREALRLGLDRDDIIVRRRLAQKMGFLLEDNAALVDPTEPELRRFFEAHEESYKASSRITLAHVFVSTEARRDEEAESMAEEILGELRARAAASGGALWRSMGDPFMLHREYADRTEQELVELFGSGFVAGLRRLEAGPWQGPIPSVYGLHLVRIERRAAEPRPSFEALRTRVMEDYLRERRQAANEAAFQELRDRYRVFVEVPLQGDLRESSP